MKKIFFLLLFLPFFGFSQVTETQTNTDINTVRISALAPDKIAKALQDLMDNKATAIAYPTSGTNTYTVSINAKIVSYTTGLTIPVFFNIANTGPATLSVNGLLAKALVKNVSTALVSGDLPIGLSWCYYDGTNFRVSSPGSGGGGGGTVTSVSGTNNRVTSTLGTAPILDISATFESLLGKVASPLSQFAATTSSQFAGVISDETGTGSVVYSISPSLTGNPTVPTQSPADNSTKIANTAYVDAAIVSQRSKEAAKYASVTALPAVTYANGASGVGATLTENSNGALSLDGSTPSVNDRVLIKNQSSTFQNGIYVVTTVGSGAAVFVLTRATDFDQAADIKTGDAAFVSAGSTLTSTTWAYNGASSPVIGTDPITIVQTAGQGSFTSGNGISIVSTSIAIDPAVTVDKTTAQTLTNKTLTNPILTTPTLGTPGSGNFSSGSFTWPTFNQNTTGSAATWTTARNIAGNSVNGSADVVFPNKFIVQGTTDSGLSGAQFLGALGNGLVKNANSTGVLSIATNADLPVMTSTVGGAVPTPPNDPTKFLNGQGSFATPSGSGTVTTVASADASVTITNATTTPDLKVVKINQGTSYTQVGTLLDELFPGSTLNATNWSGSLPTGASISSKLIIASGVNDWVSRFIQLQKFYLFENETFEIYFKAITKNSGDAWGITQNPSLLTLFNNPIFIKFDQFTGILSIGSTTAANEYGSSQPLTYSVGDQLKVTLTKKPGKTLAVLENITTPSTLKATGSFSIDIKSTGGQYRLAFLGGQQEFSEFKISSQCINFGGTSGAVWLGDSHIAGSGTTDIAFRASNRVMDGQTDLFENIGIGSWLSGTFTAGTRLNEFLSGINAKNLYVSIGYNDFAQSVSNATYEANLETIATTAQGLGYTVTFVSIVPSFSVDNSAYDTQMQTAATNTGSGYINIRSALLGSGTTLNQNFLYSDGVHMNNAGHKAWADAIKLKSNNLSSLLAANDNNTDVRFGALRNGNASMPLAVIGSDGYLYKMSASNYINENSPILQSTLYNQQSGAIGITGQFLSGGPWQQLVAAGQGLQIGFNNGVNNTACSNINITNAGTGGTGSPQAFNNITGFRNLIIDGVSAKTNAVFAVSGNDNILIQTNLGNSATLSGSSNTVLNSTQFFSATSAHDNIGTGSIVFKTITTGSQNIAFTQLTSFDGSTSTAWAAGSTGTILIGTPYDNTGSELLANGEACINPYGNGQRIFTFGPKGGAATSVIWRAGYQGGTNVTGYTHYLDAPRGTGTGLPGDIRFRFSIPGSTGTTVHSTYTEGVILSRIGTTLSQAALTASWAPVLTVTPGANTGITLSTPKPNVLITGTTQQWATGALSGQANFEIGSETLAFVGASTATEPTGLLVHAPTAGTNANTFVRPSALTLDGDLFFKTGGTVFGIIGTTTNDAAITGNIGEAVSSLVATGGAVSLTTATSGNITSISLTAGDWDVEGLVNYKETASTVTARTASMGSTSATLANDGTEGNNGVQSTLTSEVNTISLPRKRFSLSGTTTIYLVAQATFSAGTCAGYGYITARRVR